MSSKRSRRLRRVVTLALVGASVVGAARRASAQQVGLDETFGWLTNFVQTFSNFVGPQGVSDYWRVARRDRCTLRIESTANTPGHHTLTMDVPLGSLSPRSTQIVGGHWGAAGLTEGAYCSYYTTEYGAGVTSLRLWTRNTQAVIARTRDGAPTTPHAIACLAFPTREAAERAANAIHNAARLCGAQDEPF